MVGLDYALDSLLCQVAVYGLHRREYVVLRDDEEEEEDKEEEEKEDEEDGLRGSEGGRGRVQGGGEGGGR